MPLSLDDFFDARSFDDYIVFHTLCLSADIMPAVEGFNWLKVNWCVSHSVSIGVCLSLLWLGITFVITAR